MFKSSNLSPKRNILQNVSGKQNESGLKKCRCIKFIPANSKPNEKIRICECGLPEYKHNQDAIDFYQNMKDTDRLLKEWTPEACTVNDENTDAYGEIRFANTKQTSSKYLRIDFRTPAEDVMKIMFGNWRMYHPKLLISITGGAKSFDVKPNLKKALNRGIVKAALGTNAWLITGGNEEGVMKNIGEAVKETISTLDPNKKIVLLGIANWTTVKNNHKLIKKDNKMTSNYSKFDNDNELKSFITKQSPLDPNHTHFILVDNAKLNKFGGEIDFRAELESKICSYNFNNTKSHAGTNEKIPLVVIVVGGGPNTFELCLKSVKSLSPCIFIEDTGGCANIFAFVYKKIEETKSEKENENIDDIFNEDFKNEIKELVKKFLPEKTNQEHSNIVQKIIECFKYMSLITIVALESSENIDEAILYSLLKAESQKSQDQIDKDQDQFALLKKSQLRLALTWNRIDIAEKFIFNDEKKFETYFFRDIMFTALKNDNYEFIKAFLKNGLVLSKFLTYRYLLKLYNDIPKNSHLFLILLNRKRNKWRKLDETQIILRFKDIGQIIQSLLDNFYTHEYLKFPFNQIRTKDSKKILDETDDFGNPKPGVITSTLYKSFEEIDIEEFCQNPAHELLMYTILTNKPKLVKLFLKEGKNEIIGSLIASKIFQSYSKIFEEDTNMFSELAIQFEKSALDMLDLSHRSDPKYSKLLIMRQVREFGYCTCLQIAKIGDCINFLSHPTVQELLSLLWYKRLSSDTSVFNLTISLICPLAAPYLCYYKTNNKIKSSDEANNTGEKEKLMEEKKIDEFKTIKPVINRIDLSDDYDHTKSTYFKKLIDFMRTPLIKFVYDKILFLIFLLLFSYVMLCDFYPVLQSDNKETSKYISISWIETLVIIWVFTYLTEEIHQFYVMEAKIFSTKIKLFFSEFWNLIEFAAVNLFILGMILRFIPESPGCFSAAKIVLSLDIILWYFKSLHAYVNIKWMGPKLIMIRRMFVELASFTLILLVCMFAFGIATQSLLYHNVPPSDDLLKNIFFPAFFIIGGEYYTRDTIMSAESCVVNDTSREITDIYSLDDCPDYYGSQISLFIYTCYLVFLNILLTNLLIAIFSNTYEKIEQESDKLWKTQRYQLVYEYFHKTFLLPPFIVFYYMGYLIKLPLRLIRRTFFKEIKATNSIINKIFIFMSQSYRNGFKVNFHKDQINKLIMWENNVSEEYVQNEEYQDEIKVESKLKQNLEKYNTLVDKFNVIMKSRSDTLDKIQQLDTCLDQVIEIIKHHPKYKEIFNAKMTLAINSSIDDKNNLLEQEASIYKNMIMPSEEKKF